MMENKFKKFAKGEITTKDITPGNAVLYNRVSSKEQEENQSLEVQHDTIMRYAERYNLTIIEKFGGTFESAKSDKERKEFSRMLAFIRKNKKLNIKYVIVYNTKRFSRTGSTSIIEELELLGVNVLSATSNYNPKTASGKFNQRMELANAAFENEDKSQLTKDLGRAKLLKGQWVAKAPRGYDQKTTPKMQTTTINEEGKLIRKAFHWKADEKLTNEEIIIRLEKLGFYIKKQKLSEMLKNPFYCGIMVHSYLNGEPMKGNHPPIVSEEIFLKVNEVLESNYTGGYEQKQDKEWAPLLGSLRCPCCGYNVTASMSTKMKKKYGREVYYYVCSRKGCKCNNQVIRVHEAFTNYLMDTTIKGIDKSIFVEQLTKIFNNHISKGKSDITKMKTEKSKLQTQLQTMESNWVIETHPKKKEVLWNNIEETEKKIAGIEEEIDKYENSILNLDSYLKYAIEIAYKPLELWNKSNLGDKKRIQNLMFPKGIQYNKENSNIEPLSLNSFFDVNAINSGAYEVKEKGLFSENSEKSLLVPRAGF